MKGRGKNAALGLGLLVLAVMSARGADYPVPGTRLTLRASSTHQHLTFVVRGGFTLPTPGSGDDPTVGGATLQIFNANTGETSTLDLPSAHWTRNKPGTLFRYRDPEETEPGKVTFGVLGRSVRISGRNIGVTLDEFRQHAMAVILTTGSLRYCALFDDGSVRLDGTGIFSARKASAPVGCPVPPTTTTSTTVATTTSTSVTTSTSTSSTSTSSTSTTSTSSTSTSSTSTSSTSSSTESTSTSTSTSSTESTSTSTTESTSTT